MLTQTIANYVLVALGIFFLVCVLSAVMDVG